MLMRAQSQPSLYRQDKEIKIGVHKYFSTFLFSFGLFIWHFQPCLGYASWHVGRLGPTLLFFYNLASFHFQHCLEYINPRFSMLCHQMFSLATGSNFHIVIPPAATIYLFVHSLAEQLYAKEVYFCSFVTKSNNPIQCAPIGPQIFSCFHMTIIH